MTDNNSPPIWSNPKKTSGKGPENPAWEVDSYVTDSCEISDTYSLVSVLSQPDSKASKEVSPLLRDKSIRGPTVRNSFHQFKMARKTTLSARH